MSREQLDELRRQEEELRAKLIQARAERQRLEAEERKKEEEEKRRLELEKPIVVRVTALSGGSLLTESEYRPDVLEVWQSTAGRAFRGYTGYGDDKLGRNLIPVSEWKRAEERLNALPYLSIEWDKGVKEELDWFLNAPPWEVVVHPSRRYFIVKMGPRVSYYRLLSHIPGADWDIDSKSWKVPLSEGWRVYEALKDTEGVVYEDTAQEVILEQVEQRAKLDAIAQQEETDFIKELNGHKLRPFQGVGIEFMYATGGQMLNSDATGLGKTWQALGYAEIMRREHEGFQTVVGLKSANIPNWIREIKRLTGEEPVLCQGGTPDGAAVMKLVNGAPYALISWDTLGVAKEIPKEDGSGVEEKFLWAEVFKSVEIDLFIGDEAHLIKNPDAKRSRAARQLAVLPRRVLLTASPILNRTEELWPLLYMLNPHMFKSHGQFVGTYTYGGKRPRNVEKLHELLRPMFLRRKKADVLKDLPPINRIVRFHDLTDKAKENYQGVLRGVYENLEIYDPHGKGGGTVGVMSILAQITRLKQICAADKVAYTVDLATELIDEANNGGKVLIFSQYKGSAYAIGQALGHEAVCTVRRGVYDFESLGSVERDQLFEDARRNPQVKYIVTTEAAKEGHNLEFCNWVIFNDPLWSPLAHDQCEGRAYGRLADPHPIDSFYIIADVEVERWIMELLEQKLSIINETVEGIESTREGDMSIVTELIEKMKGEMWRRG